MTDISRKGIYDNMIMPDRSKICPSCKSEMWQYAHEMVKCVKCGLWGWLPPIVSAPSPVHGAEKEC